MKTKSVNGQRQLVVEIPMTSTLFSTHLAQQLPHSFPDSEMDTIRMLHLVRTLPWTLLNDAVARSVCEWGNDVEIIGGTEIEKRIEAIVKQRLASHHDKQ